MTLDVRKENFFREGWTLVVPKKSWRNASPWSELGQGTCRIEFVLVLYYLECFIDVGTGPVTHVRAGDW